MTSLTLTTSCPSLIALTASATVGQQPLHTYPHDRLDKKPGGEVLLVREHFHKRATSKKTDGGASR